MRLLQSGTTFRYYKVGSVLLQSGTAFLLQIETILLQSGTGITKWDSFITKRDRYYKVRRLLQFLILNKRAFALLSLATRSFL